MKAPVVLCVALLCRVPLPAVSAETPDAQTLRDRSDAAYGPMANAFRQNIEFIGTASSGKRVIYHNSSTVNTWPVTFPPRTSPCRL